MRGKRAKQIRAATYGDISSRGTVVKKDERGVLQADPMRKFYQKAKQNWLRRNHV